MMFENDPEVIQAFIDYRQEHVRAAIRRSRTPQDPSRLRVAIGIALIHAGERIRGCTQGAQVDALPPISAARMGRARHA